MFIIHDLCGISSIHRVWLKRLFNVDSYVFQRAVSDLGGVSRFYGAGLYHGKTSKFILRSFYHARRYDLIHIHSLDTLVWLLKRWRKPIVLEYHGSEIRGNGDEHRRWYDQADRVLVSTPDLLKDLPKAQWLPNPVDTELFKPMREHNDNKALYHAKGMCEYGEDYERPFRLAEKHGLDLMVLHKQAYTIPYEEMPFYLNQFSWFIDVCFYPGYMKGTNYLSRTALEALACGLKVVRFDDVVVEGLPTCHKPESVVRELMEVYKELA